MSTTYAPEPAAVPNGEPLPPHDLLAEQSVLGGMMLSFDAIPDVTAVMGSADFYRPAHSLIYDAIMRLFAAGEPTDAVTVSAELERHGELTRVGGAPYLHTLLATVPTAANANWYAEIVAEKAQLRRLVQAGMRITQLGYAAASGDEVSLIVDRAQGALDAVTDARTAHAGYTLLSDLRPTELSLLDDVQAGRIPPGLSTGFYDLDHITGGLRGGQFIVVAGRPGMGKSTLAVDFARANSIRGDGTSVIFTLEMSRTEIWRRIVAAESKIRLTALTTPGALTPKDQDDVHKGLNKIDNGGPLFIDDTASITVAEIRAKARRIRARHGLDLIVVDYLQLMTSGRRVESRQVEVSEMSRNLKLLAKDLDVPVVGVCQLNRGPEQRADKRPMLADLRESGSLEQDADMVILLHRPDMYDRDDPRAGEADLILAKNRSGPTGVVTVASQLHYSRFADLAKH
ncbi:replicative DNA helicase [Actinophytocola sp.]|uniref:replicative DNA helicase n=1 Tax=Actinophytocola sp. TaxID=1872138 RepID=UPI002ED31D92